MFSLYDTTFQFSRPCLAYTSHNPPSPADLVPTLPRSVRVSSYHHTSLIPYPTLATSVSLVVLDRRSLRAVLLLTVSPRSRTVSSGSFCKSKNRRSHKRLLRHRRGRHRKETQTNTTKELWSPVEVSRKDRDRPV